MDLVLEMHTDSCTRTVYSLLVDVVPLGLGSRHLPPDPVGRPSPDGLTPVAEARAEGRRATEWTCHDVRVSDDRKTSTSSAHRRS